MTPSITASPTSALAFASTRVPIAYIGENVGEVRDRLVGGDRLESAAQIAVLHDGQLLGLVRIEDLLSSSRDVPVVSVMDSDPPFIDPRSDQEAVAAKAVQQQESSLAVVGPNGRFVGLIPPYRMLGVLLEEHREDMARLSGYLHQSAGARAASRNRRCCGHPDWDAGCERAFGGDSSRYSLKVRAQQVA